MTLELISNLTVSENSLVNEREKSWVLIDLRHFIRDRELFPNSAHVERYDRKAGECCFSHDGRERFGA